MSAYLDLPAGNAALKEWYDAGTVEILAADDNPFLTMVPKNTKATGKYVTVPIVYETSQGSSATFANALANQSPGLLAEFLVPLVPDYAIATLGHQAMLASQDDKGGFLDFATLFVDLAITSASSRQSSALFRSGTGTIGKISSISTGVITLTNPADIAQFGINQTLQANSSDGGSPRTALGYVIARDVMAGTVTVASSGMGGIAATPTSWTTSDFLLVQGDNNAKLKGLSAWLPKTSPATSSSFYNVDRSVDSRLYGLYFNGSNMAVEEALIDAAMLVRREGGRPKHLIWNYGSEAALIKALGARREFCDWKGPGEIGFRGVNIQGPAGVIECFGDRSCEAGAGYLVQMNTWKLHSLNTVPHVARYGDGLDMLRLSSADASEVRVNSYAALASRAPGWSSQIAFSV